jgi:hypothetical protein
MKRLMCFVLLSITSVVALAACGKDTSGPATATGRLIDGPVAGVSYVSGGQKGVTGTDGTFTYEVGQPVKFTIGAMVLGQLPAKGIITPMDLTNNDAAAATKMVQLLMSLDDHSNTSVSGGMAINLTPAQVTALNGLSQVDFASADDQKIKDVLVAMNIPATNLVDSDTAGKHLNDNILNLFVGTYSGTFSGKDSSGVPVTGTFTLTIAANGAIAGSGARTGGSGSPLTGTMHTDSTFELTDSDGTKIKGTVDPASGGFNGKLESSSGSGTFTGSKGAPAAPAPATPGPVTGAAVFAGTYSGTFSGADQGNWSITISAAGVITGTAQSTTGSPTPLTGSIDGSGHFTLNAPSSSTGGTGTGTINSATGALTGTWVAANPPSAIINLAGQKS